MSPAFMFFILFLSLKSYFFIARMRDVQKYSYKIYKYSKKVSKRYLQNEKSVV